MKTLLCALAATITLSAATAAIADGTPAATPLHPALLSAPIYAAHADGSRLMVPTRKERAVAGPLHPALLVPPVFTVHVDVSRLFPTPAAPIKVSQIPN
ncbi:hypothetical protein [Azospirillum halopraeferens]|uniref:hypothetical protein n=1 Tax=Azospirillum halopraeferens TaxID=34010 RepID=UPI000402AC2B|nr:hypothetical protein [Azospirillum halopraeferens]